MLLLWSFPFHLGNDLLKDLLDPLPIIEPDELPQGGHPPKIRSKAIGLRRVDGFNLVGGFSTNPFEK